MDSKKPNTAKEKAVTAEPKTDPSAAIVTDGKIYPEHDANILLAANQPALKALLQTTATKLSLLDPQDRLIELAKICKSELASNTKSNLKLETLKKSYSTNLFGIKHDFYIINFEDIMKHKLGLEHIHFPMLYEFLADHCQLDGIKLITETVAVNTTTINNVRIKYITITASNNLEFILNFSSLKLCLSSSTIAQSYLIALAFCSNYFHPVKLAREQYCTSLQANDSIRLIEMDKVTAFKHQRVAGLSVYVVPRQNGNTALITNGLWDGSTKDVNAKDSKANATKIEAGRFELLVEAKTNDLDMLVKDDISTSWLYQVLIAVAEKVKVRSWQVTAALNTPKKYFAIDFFSSHLPLNTTTGVSDNGYMILGIGSKDVPSSFIIDGRPVHVITAKLVKKDQKISLTQFANQCQSNSTSHLSTNPKPTAKQTLSPATFFGATVSTPPITPLPKTPLAPAPEVPQAVSPHHA